MISDLSPICVSLFFAFKNLLILDSFPLTSFVSIFFVIRSPLKAKATKRKKRKTKEQGMERAEKNERQQLISFQEHSLKIHFPSQQHANIDADPFFSLFAFAERAIVSAKCNIFIFSFLFLLFR